MTDLRLEKSSEAAGAVSRLGTAQPTTSRTRRKRPLQSIDVAQTKDALPTSSSARPPKDSSPILGAPRPAARLRRARPGSARGTSSQLQAKAIFGRPQGTRRGGGRSACPAPARAAHRARARTRCASERAPGHRPAPAGAACVDANTTQMSFLKGLCGGAAGAAAYNMYQTTDLSSGGSVAATLFEAFQRKGAAQVAEVSRMHRQVEDLQSALLKSLHDRQPQTVVLHSGSKSGSTVAGVAVVVGGVVLYLRFVKGWKFADMMYVTKGALSSMQESVNSGISSMRSQVEAATSDLVARLSAVADKQEDLLGKQEEMDGELRDVGERVDGVAAGVEQLQVQVAYGNHAITMLCGALAEVAKRVGLHNGRYVRALDGLVHGAPQRISDGGAAGGQAVLQGVEPLLLLDSAALAPNSPERGGGPGPRPNPAVFVLAGDAGSGRAAAAVAAGAVPRHVTAPGSTFSGGPGAGGGSQQPASTWGRSVSESYRPKAS